MSARTRNGTICPACGSNKSTVLDTRTDVNDPKYGGFARRRRECLNCQHRWTTAEVYREELQQFEKQTEAISNFFTEITSPEGTHESRDGKKRKKERGKKAG